MKYIKLFELHNDTIRSARDKHYDLTRSEDSIIKKYDKFLDTGEHIDIPKEDKEKFAKQRKEFRKDKDTTLKNWRESISTVETFLPLFPGFYNSIYEPDCSNELDDINSQREYNGLEPIDDSNIEWDNTQYESETSKKVCDSTESIIKDLGFFIEIKYQSLVRPKSYNYSNDSIDIEMSFKRREILDYINNNESEFIEFLEENFKSRSGFHSFTSYDIDDWIEYISELKDHSDKIGYVFEFILRNESIDDSTIYDNINDHAYITALNYDELVNDDESDTDIE